MWTFGYLNPLLFTFFFHLSFPTCINSRGSYPAPSPPALLIVLSFNHFDCTVSLCQLCFVIFCQYCYITFIFAFHLNLATHHILTPPKHLSLPHGSICDCVHTLCLFCLISISSLPFLLPLCLTFVLRSLSLTIPCASPFSCVAMLERMSRRSRSLLSLTLTTLALALSILALCTSYWCEGTHKVVKPLCLSPVKMKNCGQNNSEPYTTGTETLSPFTSNKCLCCFILSLLAVIQDDDTVDNDTNVCPCTMIALQEVSGYFNIMKLAISQCQSPAFSILIKQYQNNHNVDTVNSIERNGVYGCINSVSIYSILYFWITVTDAFRCSLDILEITETIRLSPGCHFLRWSCCFNATYSILYWNNCHIIAVD